MGGESFGGESHFNIMTNKNKEVEEGSWIKFVENGKCGLELIATGLTSCHLAGKHQ